MRMPQRPNDPAVRHRRRAPTAPSAPLAPLLDMSEVAETLGVTHRHVQRLVSERRIPYFKVGRFIRFDPAELNVWLDERRVEMHVPPTWLERHGG
jgi:excisionase family DNA binding protein